MTWKITTLTSIIAICITIIIIEYIRKTEKCQLNKQNFEQSEKLEDKKQKIALALIEKRKPKNLQEKIDELNSKISELEKKIQPTDDQTKNDLSIAKAQIAVYQECLKLLKSEPCTN